MAGLKFYEDEYLIASNGFPYSPKKLRDLMKSIDRKRKYVERDEMKKIIKSMPFNIKGFSLEEYIESVRQIRKMDLRYTSMMDPNKYLMDDPRNLVKAGAFDHEGIWVFQFESWDEMKDALVLESENYKFDKESKQMVKKASLTGGSGLLGGHPDYAHGHVAFANATFGRIGPKNAIFLDDHMW